MYARIAGKTVGFAVMAVFAVSFGFAAAADTTDAAKAAADAVRASRNIDQSLQRTAGEFNRELEQADKQFREARRLGTPSSVTNRYGNVADIDDSIQRTVDKANAELRDAGHRDDYTFKRRELETTRSLSYPGSDEYNRLTRDIEQLDRDFSNAEREYVW